MASQFTISGTVYLAGAGPGAASLLTLRAAEVLREADLVLHDDLVSEAVLQIVPAHTAVFNVGKRCGTKKVTQEEINQRMVSAARNGLTVVRLKSGDPLVFGRTQEEILALREAGVPFEIVPGITAATAAAAAAQIPLTERSSASKLVFVSNHPGTEKVKRNWHESVARDATLVFYMPGGSFAELRNELTERGVSENLPCLLVSNVSREDQRMIRTVVRELEGAPVLAAPSLLIVGEAVAGATGCEEYRAKDDAPLNVEEILLLDTESARITAD